MAIRGILYTMRTVAKKKKKRRKKKKVEDCGSNMEQRRPEVIPAVHRRTGEKLVSSRIKS